MSLPSGTAPQFEEKTAAERQASRRMTTKEKRTAEAALKRKEQTFKKMIGLCAYECKVMRSELLEVIDYGGGEFIKEKEKVDATSWNWLRCEGVMSMSYSRVRSLTPSLPSSQPHRNPSAETDRMGWQIARVRR
jgi:hypothetical protein